MPRTPDEGRTGPLPRKLQYYSLLGAIYVGLLLAISILGSLGLLGAGTIPVAGAPEPLTMVHRN